MAALSIIMPSAKVQAHPKSLEADGVSTGIIENKESMDAVSTVGLFTDWIIVIITWERFM